MQCYAGSNGQGFRVLNASLSAPQPRAFHADANTGHGFAIFKGIGTSAPVGAAAPVNQGVTLEERLWADEYRHSPHVFSQAEKVLHTLIAFIHRPFRMRHPQRITMLQLCSSKIP